MPFLSHLLERENYLLRSHYSGLPSTTPAVQAELFYGVRGAVPSFGFRDHRSGRVTSFFDMATAARWERKIRARARGPALLEGGSSYANIYRGGADKARFCFSALGEGGEILRRHPLSLLLLMLLYSFIALRAGVLVILETGLALLDFARGVAGRYGIVQEMKFVFSRVAICIVLRELVTASVHIDIVKDLPVIHANFLGYDEQAHRRGPSSAFAHWSLKGIDDCLRRIWRFAHRGGTRDYDIWIYSDHGQEEVLPYGKPKPNGHGIAEAVRKTLDEQGVPANVHGVRSESTESRRGYLLGRFFRRHDGNTDGEGRSRVWVTGIGPLNHIYFEKKMGATRRGEIARALVEKAGIPLAMTLWSEHTARAWTDRGVFSLPADIRDVLGDRGAFEKDIAEDLMRLLHHPDTGDIVVSGYKKEGPVTSFPREYGSHAGPGPDETHGFALLPADAPLARSAGEYVRPIHIRRAALRFLSPLRRFDRRPAPESPDARLWLRVMTYNVHGCVGMDNRLRPDRFARIIAAHSPDVVALQEIDVGRARSRGMHQARMIADLLDMQFHFHPCFTVENEQYGVAVLSHLPIRVVRAGPLPGRPGREPRGVLWVEVDTGNGTAVQLLTTHLGLSRREKREQVGALTGPDWLGHPSCTSPRILCGDFNARPGSRVHRLLTKTLTDVYHGSTDRPSRTWMGIARIDYVLVSPEMNVRCITVPRSRLTRTASDHLPVLVDLSLGTG